MSESYVRRLFDQYASRYDSALTQHLAYRGPILLREAVEQAMRTSDRPPHFASMLDLGCGTGLAGEAFRKLVGRMVGVDLSSAMAAQAEAKHLYDRLVTADITEFLLAAVKDGALFDLVIAADVFVYVNDPAAIIAAAAAVLAPGGVLAFTVETDAGADVRLLPTLRYAHGEPYIRRALAAAGLVPASIAPVAVRTERGVPVEGLVVVALASTRPPPPATSGG